MVFDPLPQIYDYSGKYSRRTAGAAAAAADRVSRRAAVIADRVPLRRSGETENRLPCARVDIDRSRRTVERRVVGGTTGGLSSRLRHAADVPWRCFESKVRGEVSFRAGGRGADATEDGPGERRSG